MFIVILNFKKSLAIVDEYLSAHRAWLDEGYKNNVFIASGPKKPRDGGIIISQLKSREQLNRLLEEDPFYTHDIASYEIIEFNPTKYHPNFEEYI